MLWLRIAAAAAVFAIWRRPWRLAGRLDRRQLVTLLALGGVLAGMNTFALMLALLPAVAVVIGAVVLHQIPSVRELAGIALVIAGIAIHQAGTT